MSAFIIPLAHMDALLAYAALEIASGDRLLCTVRLTVPGDSELSADGAPVQIDFADAETRDDVGRILYAANADGLAAVYPDPTSPGGEQIAVARALAESYTFKPSAATTDAATIIGAVDCAEYQCDSAESYPMSLAQWILAAVRAKAAGELRQGWTIEDDSRAAELEALESKLATAPAATGDAPAEPEPTSRAAILARMGAALTGEAAPALPDPAEPTPEPTAGPKPEPETAAKAKAKAAGKAAKGRKAPAAAAGKNKSGKRAKPPAKKSAAAPRAKGKAPLNA